MDATTKDVLVYGREYILDHLIKSLQILKDSKPDDRSDDDRRFAIIITELEKVIAYYAYHLAKVDKEL